MAYKYVEVKERILEQALRTGTDQLPSENQICATYGVSRTTAIKALNSLAKDNLARREVGRGTFLNRSQVKTQVHFLIGRGVPEIMAFARDVASLFMAQHPFTEVRVHEVNSRDWVNAIVTTPGLKVILSTHVGFLSNVRLLVPLHQLDGFQDTVNQINADMVDWRHDQQMRPLCDSLPLFLSPAVLAFNRRYAEALGLDAEHGPNSWQAIHQWFEATRSFKRGSQAIYGAHIKRNNVLPLSYYLTVSGGKHFIRSHGDDAVFDFTYGEAWLQFFRGLHETGLMPVYPNEKPDSLLFGRSLMSFEAATWIVNQIRIFKTKDPIGICPVPPPEPGGGSFADVGKAELAIVDEGLDDPSELEAAWAFLRFLVGSAEAQRALTKHFSCLAVNREVFQEQQADPVWVPFVRALATGRIRCDHPVQHNLMKILYKYYYAAVLDGMPCDAAARAIEESCQLHLEIAASA